MGVQPDFKNPPCTMSRESRGPSGGDSVGSPLLGELNRGKRVSEVPERPTRL